MLKDVLYFTHKLEFKTFCEHNVFLLMISPFMNNYTQKVGSAYLLKQKN